MPNEPRCPSPHSPLQQDFSELSLPPPSAPAFKTVCSMTAGKPNLVQILLQPCWFLFLFTSINFNGFPYINFVLNQLEENSYSLSFWRIDWVIFPCHLTASLGCSGMTATLGTSWRAINSPRLGEEDLHIPESTAHSLFSLGLGLCWLSKWKFLPPVQHGKELTEPDGNFFLLLFNVEGSYRACTKDKECFQTK